MMLPAPLLTLPSGPDMTRPPFVTLPCVLGVVPFCTFYSYVSLHMRASCSHISGSGVSQLLPNSCGLVGREGIDCSVFHVHFRSFLHHFLFMVSEWSFSCRLTVLLLPRFCPPPALCWGVVTPFYSVPMRESLCLLDDCRPLFSTASLALSPGSTMLLTKLQ